MGVTSGITMQVCINLEIHGLFSQLRWSGTAALHCASGDNSDSIDCSMFCNIHIHHDIKQAEKVRWP